MPPDNDHDKLVRIDTSLDILISQFKNHLKHHFAIDLLLASAVVGLIIKMLMTPK